MLPRNDERKKALGLAIRNAIHNSKDLEQFTRTMQSKGYKVIQGRGISFIDDKKVKIKGSEVGYSLQKIQQDLNFLQRLKTDREFFNQVNERKPLRSLAETVSNLLISRDDNISLAGQLKQDVSETVDALLKPQQTPEQIEPKLLVKKKERKKKRELHL